MYSQEAEQIKWNESEHRKAVRELIANAIDDGEVAHYMTETAATYRALRAELLSAMQRIDNMQDYGNDNMSAIITLIENLRSDEMMELEMHVASAV
jgi:hypothetical protein